MSKINKKIFEKFDGKIDTPDFSQISKKIEYPTYTPTKRSYKWLSPCIAFAFSIVGVLCLITFTNNIFIGVGNNEIESPTEALSIKSWDEKVELIGNQIYYDLPMVYNSCDLTEVLNFSVNSWDVYDGTTLLNKEEVPLSYGANDFTIELSRFNTESVAYNITVNVGQLNHDNFISIDNIKTLKLHEGDINLVINTYEEFKNFLQTHDYNIESVSDYDELYFINKALVLKSAKVDIKDIKMFVQNQTLYISGIKEIDTSNTLYVFEINDELKNTFNQVNFDFFGIQLNNQTKSK